jgi:hypothetical protein
MKWRRADGRSPARLGQCVRCDAVVFDAILGGRLPRTLHRRISDPKFDQVYRAALSIGTALQTMQQKRREADAIAGSSPLTHPLDTRFGVH